MEKQDLINELCLEALKVRNENFKCLIADEIASNVRSKLEGGMSKKEFAIWFETYIAEFKCKTRSYLDGARGW